MAVELETCNYKCRQTARTEGTNSREEGARVEKGSDLLLQYLSRLRASSPAFFAKSSCRVCHPPRGKFVFHFVCRLSLEKRLVQISGTRHWQRDKRIGARSARRRRQVDAGWGFRAQRRRYGWWRPRRQRSEPGGEVRHETLEPTYTFFNNSC